MLIKPVAVILDRRALTFGKFKIRINPLMMKWPEIVFTNSANFTKKNCSKSAMRHLRSSTSHFPCLFPIKFTSIKTFANFFCNLIQTKHNRIRKQTLLRSKFISAPFTGLKKLECHSKREILVVLLREGNDATEISKCQSLLSRFWVQLQTYQNHRITKSFLLEKTAKIIKPKLWWISNIWYIQMVFRSIK